MVEFLSIFVSIAGLAFTIFLEWPRIQQRFSKSSTETAPATPPPSPSPENTPPTPALKNKMVVVLKIIAALLVALIYMVIFAGIFIPFGNDEIVGVAAVIFGLLSIFWAFRYIRHQSFKMILMLFGLGILLYLCLGIMLSLLGYLDN